MGVGSELRKLLWSERDWCEALRREGAAVRALPLDPAHAPRALELAAACEEIDPDRSRAVEMYLVAWRHGRQPGSLASARALCNELGDLASAVKIARLEHQHTGDPRLLHEEGVALLDLGQPDEAVAPLLHASRALPGDPAVAAALAAARREWPDPRAELERLIGAARDRGTSREAGALYLQAARLVRLQQGDEQLYGRLLLAAFECAPREDATFGRLEDYLIQRGGSDELLALYRRRIEVAPDVATRYEDLRRAGTHLVTRDVQPGLGLRLLDRGLREAYGHAVDPIRGQLASLELLHRHAAASRSLPRYLGLLADALSVARDDDVVVWLAARAVDVSFAALGQAEVARAYAGRLAERAPQHPALRDYLAQGGLPETDIPIDEAPSDDDQLVYLDSGTWHVPAEAIASHDDSGGLTLAEEPPRRPQQPIGLAAATRPPAAPLPAPAPPPAPPEPELDLELTETPTPTPPPQSPQPSPARGGHAGGAKPQPARAEPGTTLGRVAVVAVPASVAKPSSVIPQNALDALRAAASARLGLVPAPVLPATARDRAPRLEIPIDVTLTLLGGDTAMPAVTRDLSASGMFAVTSATLERGDSVDAALSLPTADPLVMETFTVRARVVRVSPGGYGLVFVEPPARLTAAIDEVIQTHQNPSDPAR